MQLNWIAFIMYVNVGELEMIGLQTEIATTKMKKKKRKVKTRICINSMRE